MKTYTVLVEIGTDELPAKVLKRLGKDFFYQVIIEFNKNNICYDEINWFASACHLAIKAKIKTQKEIYNNTLMYKFDDAYICDKSDDYKKDICNLKNTLITDDVIIENNVQKHEKCENTLIYSKDKIILKNDNFTNLFNRLINNALSKLINYKMMHWNDIAISFIRPVRTMTILLDQYLILGCFFGVNTDRVLYGNRCMGNNKIILHHADDYPEILMKKGSVIVDYNVRKNIIYSEIKKKAKELGGSVNTKDNELLEEITALVEWPVILFGKFDKQFLQLPYEVILHIMKHDQKYFPVYDSVNGLLLPYFIFVVNTISDDYSHIISGYENVIKTRLVDARFFLKCDSRRHLEDYISTLDSVLFHRKLGSLRDKSIRIKELSGWIASQIGADIEKTKRSGYLCKCDLMSNMVFEFPSTQGYMGMHYALHDGESKEVALAQKEHYQPRYSHDTLPTNYISCAVSIADKMDTISGMFGIKELPKGNRDPFALKRSALGILRILIDKKLPLNLISLIKKSIALYGTKLTNQLVFDDVYAFMYQRLFSWYLVLGYKSNIIKSVLNITFPIVTNFDAHINAVNNFYTLQKDKNNELYIIYKRLSHFLLKKQVVGVLQKNKEIQFLLFKAPEEVKLFNQMIIVENDIEFLFSQCRFYDALISITTLCYLINQFFNNVRIMDDDQNIKVNRLILLNKIKTILFKVVDISILYS